MIPFLDLKRVNEPYIKKFNLSFQKSLEKGEFIMGESLNKFENEFADFCGTSFAIGVASGLDALKLSLRAWKELGKLKNGDEVIVQANTYIATILAIVENDLVPVLVDIDPDSRINLDSLAKCISKKTKIIIPVHLFGRLNRMDQIIEIAKNENLLILEDSAQSHGASLKGKKSGSFGNAGAFSFYPTKNLGALGDGGAITTNDSEFKNILEHLRNYGSKEKYISKYIGGNSRLDSIQAAFLSIKLKNLNKENDLRKKIAKRYHKEINNKFIKKPDEIVDESHVYHLFTVETDFRDSFQGHLNNNQIGSMIHYPIPPHKQEAFSHMNNLNLPMTEQISKKIVSLPLAPYLLNTEIEKIIEVANSFSPKK